MPHHQVDRFMSVALRIGQADGAGVLTQISMPPNPGPTGLDPMAASDLPTFRSLDMCAHRAQGHDLYAADEISPAGIDLPVLGAAQRRKREVGSPAPRLHKIRLRRFAASISASTTPAPSSLTDWQATDMKRFDLMMGINTRGTLSWCRILHPHLKKAENPHILMLSRRSTSGEWFAHSTAYTLAKFGMSLCVLGLAAELKGAGVAVKRAVAAAPPSRPPRSAISWAATP